MTKLQFILKAIFVLCLTNFLVFWIVGFFLGGGALNGKIEGGRYYLGDRADHTSREINRFTEVSQTVFAYSLWHGRSLFITHPLLILVGIIFSFDRGHDEKGSDNS